MDTPALDPQMSAALARNDEIVRGLGDDIYYNSDIVQLCYSNPEYIEVLRSARRGGMQHSRH